MYSGAPATLFNTYPMSRRGAAGKLLWQIPKDALASVHVPTVQRRIRQHIPRSRWSPPTFAEMRILPSSMASRPWCRVSTSSRSSPGTTMNRAMPVAWQTSRTSSARRSHEANIRSRSSTLRGGSSSMRGMPDAVMEGRRGRSSGNLRARG